MKNKLSLDPGAADGAVMSSSIPTEPKLSAYPGAMPGSRRLTRLELEQLRKQTREASVRWKMEVDERG